MGHKFFAVAAFFLSAAVVSGAELVGPDKVFVRFTSTRPDESRLVVRVNIVPNDQEPFDWKGKTLYLAADGEHARSDIPLDQWLRPGQSSPWVDLGRYMTLRGARSSENYLSPVLCGVLTSPPVDGLHLTAEVARGRTLAVIRRIEIDKPEIKHEGPREYPWRLGFGTWNLEPPFLPTLGLLIPTRENRPQQVHTLQEALDWQLGVIQGFTQFGRLPTQIVFRTTGRPQILQALGYNDYPPGTIEANLGDEIQLSIELPQEKQDALFRAYLRERGFNPLDLMSGESLARAGTLTQDEQWQLVRLLPPLHDNTRHFYESANFRYRLWHDQLARRKLAIEAQHPGKRVLAGANFTPAGSGWPDVRHWIDPFRSGALTMCWTEDWWWFIADPTPQTYGFLLDALRLAGSYHRAPIQFYVMPFHGQTPDHFRRMNTLALAHGVKILNHFHTEDQVLTTWDYIDLMDAPPMYQAIHDVIREVGAVEHRLHSGMPQPAKVAIMLSRAADTWDTEDMGGAGDLTTARYNVNNYERKALWLALRQAQVPVDLITDEDIPEGMLEPYRVLYVVGAEMLAKAVEPLKKWVHSGGILYATAGCGLLDEYRRPLTTLHEMYGLNGHTLTRRERQIDPKVWLPKTPALDRLKVKIAGSSSEELTIEAVCYREVFQTLSSATVTGRYQSDDQPGAVTSRYGQGRTICVGALAGLAFLKPAMVLPPQILPTRFPSALRDFVTAPVRWSGVVPPVTASDPLVEAQYMTGPDGAIVLLINWRQQPMEDLVLQFPGAREVRSVRSLRQAGVFHGRLEDQSSPGLNVEIKDGVPQVRLRLDITDYLLVD